MPKYQYSCSDCSGHKGEDGSSTSWDNSIPWFDEEVGHGLHPETLEFLFVVECKMADKPKKPKCPNCGGTHTQDSFTDYKLECYIRGDGIVKDRAGARRDMNRHHLVNQDPYGHMRQSGEVDHMLDQMRDRGRDMGKVRADRARVSREAAERARKAKLQEQFSEDQAKAIIIMYENYENDRDTDFSEFSEIEDANKVLSELIKDCEYAYKNKDNKFVLMAAGRKAGEELTEEDD